MRRDAQIRDDALRSERAGEMDRVQGAEGGRERLSSPSEDCRVEANEIEAPQVLVKQCSPLRDLRVGEANSNADKFGSTRAG